MARYRAGARRLKLHLSYTAEEAAKVVGVHRNTMRRWFGTGSFRVMTEARPHLVIGRHLKAYLEGRESVKTRLGRGECYCLGCKAARKPALGMVEISSCNGLTVNVRGLCPDCERLMYRRVSIARLDDIFPELKVPLQEAGRHLRVRDGSCSNVDSGDP